MVPPIDSSMNASHFSFSKIVSKSIAVTKRVIQFIKSHAPFFAFGTLAIVSLLTHKWTLEQVGYFSTYLLICSGLFYVFAKIANPTTSFSVDPESLGKKLVEEARKKLIDADLFYRKVDMDQLLIALSTHELSNVALVGLTGSGKTSLIKCLAAKIARKDKDLPETVHKWEILSVEVMSLIENTTYRGQFEARVKALVDYLVARPNTILFADEMQNLHAKSGFGDPLTLANMLKAPLTDGIRVIGATTPQEFSEFTQKDDAFARRFTKIDLASMDSETTLEALKKNKTTYEKKHQVTISDSILSYVIEVTQPLKNPAYPAKATALLDLACSRTRFEGRHTVTPEDVNLSNGLG